MKICHGCQTELHNGVKTCGTCGATFGKPREENEKAKRPGGVKGGEPLTIFIDENDKTGAKAVTLKDLKQEIDGVDDDAKVEFLVDLPKGTKNFKVSHAFVGGKVRPLKLGGLFTSTVHGHARSIRGWKVDFSASGNKRKDGTEVVKWLTRDHNAPSGTELEPFFEAKDLEGLWKAAKQLVRAISTTAPGMGIYDRLDLTSEYKQPEGSAEEETNFKRAFNYAAGRGIMKKFLFGKSDTPLEVKIFYGETPKFGQPVSLVLKLKNTSGFAISPSSLRLTANSVFQRGEVHKYLAQIEIDCGSIEAQTEKSLNCQIAYEDYRDKLAPDGQGFMRIQVLAQFNNQSASERVHICVEPPTEDVIDLELSHQTCFVGDENVKATIRLTNKLDSLLLGGKLTVDGHNLFPTANYTVPSLEIKSKVETVIDIKPTKAGTWTVVVNFATDQVVDMKAFKTIVVKE